MTLPGGRIQISAQVCRNTQWQCFEEDLDWESRLELAQWQRIQ
jgi:hypothetical protein